MSTQMGLDTQKTVLGAGCVLKGELHVTGPTIIAGRLEGVILSQDSVEITAEGVMDGDVQGSLVDVQGTVNGNIYASHACRLGSTARVNGELRAANLAIAEGATFVGHVQVGQSAIANGPVSSIPEAVEMEEAPPAPAAPAMRIAPAPTHLQQEIPLSPSQMATINRLESLTAEADDVAAEAIAAVEARNGHEPQVRIMSDSIQNTLNRTSKIIKARQ